MLREHQPAYLRRARAWLGQAYAQRFVHPHFDVVGNGTRFSNPWHVKVFGGPVRLGAHVHVCATLAQPVQFAVWSEGGVAGRIEIGDFGMINPGLRITAARAVQIGKNALFAPNVYITDADWHGTYNRSGSIGQVAAVTLDDNVWVGESALICKGVHIGTNSIVGAGSVVTRDVPENTVVAGNPATPIGHLRPDGGFVTRADLMRDPEKFYREAREAEQLLLSGNSLTGYLRYLLWPRRGD